jgi:hypothetical protein
VCTHSCGDPLPTENVPNCTVLYIISSDLTLDMSAVSLSSHVGERGMAMGAGMAAGGGGDDIRQPSVDGLHSPSSPNAPVAVVKPGTRVT